MSPPDATTLRDRLAALLVGRFEVGELLGQGGYAAVFRARDVMLGRDVAIKVFEATAGMALDQCLAEARLVATIEHPHIVPLHEVGCEAGLVYLVMRLYPDGSLARRLETGPPLVPAAVVELGATVADALATAHARGVVHLDIKPDNILLDGEDRAAVTDFGIAQAIGGAGGEHRSAGTPHYMSPEHVSGDVLDGRSDVYALGVVLYEAASGRTPITGTSATQVMANQVRQEPPSLSAVLPDFPRALAEVIDRALAKDPAARWESATALRDALRELAGSDRLQPPSVLVRRARRRWLARSALGCGLVAVGVAVAVALSVSLYRMINGGPRPAVDLLAPDIPGPLLDSLAALGLLRDGDTARYVFVPADSAAPDALIVTQSEIVRLLRGTPRRIPLTADNDYRFNLTNRDGHVIVTVPGSSSPDTLYSTLRGRELGALRDALTRLLQ
jgi:serine/threonine-protein kinase